MSSSIVLFILTFVVLGLLLGIAQVYHPGQAGQKDRLTVGENVTANVTHGNQTSGK